MALLLIRHGQTAWNLAERAQGHSDEPLDALGHAQVAALAQALAARALRHVWTSDLQRARDTAAAITATTGAPLRPTPLLRERSFGEWEGLNYAEVRARIRGLGGEPEYAAPPGGESMARVAQRLETFLRGAEHDLEHVAIVSHGGTCSMLLALLLSGDPKLSRSFRFANTGVSELAHRHDGAWTLLRYNDTSHLDAAVEAHGVVG